jgi:hypothetical protein
MKPPRRSSLWLTCVCVVTFSASFGVIAQKPGAVRITFEHDGEGVSGFVLYAEPESGKALRFDLGLVATDRSGKRTMSLPLLPDGTYRLSVSAYNGAGESARVPASPSRIVVKATPTKVLPDASAGHSTSGQPGESEPVPASAPSDRPKENGLGRLWRILVGED